MNIVSLEAHRISKQYEQHYQKCGNYDLSLDTTYITKKAPRDIAKELELGYMKLLSNQIK